MEEEIIIKQKYRKLYKNVLSIKNKIEEVEELLNETQSVMKESLLLDNKIIAEEQYTNTKKEINSISLELTNDILPNLRNHC